jgi:putative transposase
LLALHNRIADTRRDFLHKLSTKVVNENQVIIWEDLNVSGMLKNPNFQGRLVSKDGGSLGFSVKPNLKSWADSFK